MAYKITDECIACGTCASECPVEAISEGDGIFVIGDLVCHADYLLTDFQFIIP